MDHQQAMNANILDRYLLGELPAAERAEFEEHYFSCAECAEELVSAVKFVENARRPLLKLEEGRHPVPARTVREAKEEKVPWWDRWLALAPKPALAGLCAGLALVMVWQGGAGKPEPEVTGSYFVTATRSAAGTPRKIHVQRGQRRIALLFNQTDPSMTRFTFTLEDAQGRAVQQFTGGAPGDTSDLQVLIPVAGLSSGVYTLRVRDALARNEVAALPFELAIP